MKRFIRLEEDKHKHKVGSKGLFNSINSFVDYLNEECKGGEMITSNTDVYCLQVGGKYIKVVECSAEAVATGGGGRVYCFIEASSGDIYKSAGWKAPYTKGKNAVRSNVMEDTYKNTDVKNLRYGSWLYL